MHKRQYGCFRKNETNEKNISYDNAENLKFPGQTDKVVVSVKDVEVEEKSVMQNIEKEAKVFLNYDYVDEAYVYPVKELLHELNIKYSQGKFQGEEIVINFITKEDIIEKCDEVFEESKKNGSRIISILFQLPLNACIFEHEFLNVEEADINNYLMSPLLINFKNIQHRDSTLLDDLRDTLLDRISILGDGKSAVLLCGSFGFTMINAWANGISTEKVRMKGEKLPIYFLSKNKYCDYGQPLGEDARKLLDGIMHLDISEENISEAILKERILEILKTILGNTYQNLILIGALGKSSSLTLPLIAMVAKSMNVYCTSICISPFSFETNATKNMAEVSYEILKNLSSSIYGYRPKSGIELSLKEHQAYLSYAVLKTLKLVLDEGYGSDTCKEHQLVIELRD